MHVPPPLSSSDSMHRELKLGLAHENQNKTLKTWDFSHDFHQLSHSAESSTSSLVFLVLTLQKPHQFQLQLSFNFSNSVPTCPGNFCALLFGCLSLLSPPYCSFLHLKSVRSSRSVTLASCYTCSASWTSGWTVLLLWGGCPWRSSNSHGSPCPPGQTPRRFCLPGPWRSQSPHAWNFEWLLHYLLFSLPSSSQPAISWHCSQVFPKQFFLIQEKQVQFPPVSFVQHQNVVPHVFHISPKVLIPTTLPLPADVGIFTFSWKGLAYGQENKPTSW